MLQLVRRHFPYAVVFLCLCTVLPGLFLSFEDSEIWGITSGRRFVDDITVLTSAHYKPLFSAVYGAIVHFAPTDWTALLFSRWTSIIISFGGLLSLHKIARHQLESRHSKESVFFALAFLTTVPLLLVHFTKVRTDSIAASIALVGIFLMLTRPHRANLTLFIASFAVLLVTPKSIDLVAVLGVFYWYHSRSPAESGRRLQRLAWFFGPIALIVAIGLLFGRETMARIFMYWIDSYQSANFFGFEPWAHVWISAASAPINTAALLVGLSIGIFQFKKFTAGERCLTLSAAIVLGFVFIHSQKFHFFLASRLPFLALGALPGFFWSIDFVRSKWTLPDNRLVLLFSALTMVSLTSFSLRVNESSLFEMGLQHQAHEEIHKFLTDSRPNTYWDGIGIFPKMNSVFHYPSPSDRETSETLRYAEISKPTLVLYTSKMELLDPDLFIWLNQNYAQLNSLVFSRIAKIDRVYIRSNCHVSLKDLNELSASQRLQGNVILLAKIQANMDWNQIPFTTVEREANETQRTLQEIGQTQTVLLKGCENPETAFALTSERPWLTKPVPNGLVFFGYDGRL